MFLFISSSENQHEYNDQTFALRYRPFYSIPQGKRSGEGFHTIDIWYGIGIAIAIDRRIFASAKGIADGDFDGAPDSDADIDGAGMHATESEIVKKMAVTLGVLIEVLRQGLCRVPGQVRNCTADFS